MENKNNLLIPVSILGIAFIIGVTIFSLTWRGNQPPKETITVTGSAKKELVSDLGFLRGTLSVRMESASASYKELIRQRPIVIQYLKSKGFTDDQISFATVNVITINQLTPEGYQTANIIAYEYSQRIEISSKDVNKIKETSLDIASLIEQGVTFAVEPPEYHFTNLAQVKIDVQSDAAKDAMNRAGRIAEATDKDLGALIEARMGVLQITPKFSNKVDDYGLNDLSSIEKEITAVVSATFILN